MGTHAHAICSDQTQQEIDHLRKKQEVNLSYAVALLTAHDNGLLERYYNDPLLRDQSQKTMNSMMKENLKLQMQLEKKVKHLKSLVENQDCK
jgi:hypothetical protein